VTPLRIAHRGYAALGGANTLAAIDRALRLGCDAVEIDVRARRDGVLVLDHDEGDHVGAATLVDALRAIAASAAIVNLDVKEPATTAPLGEAVASAGMLGRAVCTGTCWDALVGLQRARPGIRAGLTVPRGGSRTPMPLRRLVAPLGRHRTARQVVAAIRRYEVSLVTVHHLLVDAHLVAAAHEAGAEVWCWTVDEPRDLARLEAIGVDGICSDRPASHGLGA